VTDPYLGREQTKAKHFILKGYLQELAFKVLTFSDLTYVDGFSGPWETQTDDFADTSFKIAIDVLRDAQQQLLVRTGNQRRIRCFFAEDNPRAFARLSAAVQAHHNPASRFEVQTFNGKFEDAVSRIQSFTADSFALIFIDPTGWKGVPLTKINALFRRRKCEVLINFMYDFVNRAAAMSDPKTIASLDPILGGPGWEQRLDKGLARGQAVEKLFRDTLRQVGNFAFVVSTKIDRPTADRPHFFLVYGTKSREGLIAFRDTEHRALRAHARSRADAKERKREDKTRSPDLFAGIDADAQESSVDAIVEEHKVKASADLLKSLATHGERKFSQIVDEALQIYMLREKNVKDICLKLARSGKIARTWGGGNRKPNDECSIRLVT